MEQEINLIPYPVRDIMWIEKQIKENNLVPDGTRNFRNIFFYPYLIPSVLFELSNCSLLNNFNI